MSGYIPSKEEMETIVRISRTEDMAHVWSCDPVWIRRLRSIATEDSGVVVLNEEEYDASFLVPKGSIVLGRKRRKMSDEQKAALVERLREARKRGEENEEL